MHIEPGFVAPAKVMVANATAIGVMGMYAKDLIKRPHNMAKTLLGAVFFSIFMQSFHVSVGPSELHFIGAMAMYLTLGFIPTLFGFSFGLLLQGMFFEPTDLPHLAVNSLSLMVPLITVHCVAGKELFDKSLGKRISLSTIFKLDAMYYAGVTSMVGFWLLIGDVETPFSSWLAFATSYIAIVAFEPLFTYTTVKLLKRYEGSFIVEKFFSVGRLRLAS